MVRHPLVRGYSQGIFWCEAIVRASSGVWLCIRELREKRHGEMSFGVVCSLWPWYETVA